MKIKAKVYTVCMPANKVTPPEGYPVLEKECSMCGQKVLLSPDWENNIKENNLPDDMERVIICMTCHLLKAIEGKGKVINVNLKVEKTKREHLNSLGISDEDIEKTNKKLLEGDPIELLETLRRMTKE